MLKKPTKKIKQKKNLNLTPKRVGRPSDYTKEMGDLICELISDGKSLREICSAKNMPDRASVFRWLAKEEYQEFRIQYARAREEQGSHEFDEIKEITDAEPHYYYDELGNKKIDPAWVNLQRMRADKRQWRASKLDAKKYGDSTILKGDKDNPLIVPTLQIVMSDEKKIQYW